MPKLGICVAIVLFMALAGCGVRYNWVPRESVDSRPPNVEYEGSGISDPDSEL